LHKVSLGVFLSTSNGLVKHTTDERPEQLQPISW
jgi:hypothetical protein